MRKVMPTPFMFVSLALMACFFFSATAFADFKAGEQADMRGDYRTALKEYLEAANQGNARAQNNLAVLYMKGKGTSENAMEAAKWFHKSAEQGYANAQTALGYMYLRGVGVKVNDAESVKWFSMAAKQGDSLAQFSLGVIYEKGLGFAANYKEALYWFNQAAKNNFKPAMNRLGKAYEKGELGLGKDQKVAEDWYRKASK